MYFRNLDKMSPRSDTVLPITSKLNRVLRSLLRGKYALKKPQAICNATQNNYKNIFQQLTYKNTITYKKKLFYFESGELCKSHSKLN